MILQRRRRHACERDGCPPPRRQGLPLLLGGVFVVAFAFFPEVLAWTAPGSAAQETPTTATMTRTYLEDQPEIVRASIIYAEATARVEFVAGTTAVQANRVMERISADWEGKYEFTPGSRE